MVKKTSAPLVASKKLECTEQIFSKLYNSIGGPISDNEVISFIMENGDHSCFLGKFYITVPPTNDDLLEDWDELEYWLSMFDFGISAQSFELEPSDIFQLDGFEFDELPAPSYFCSTLKTLKSITLKKVLSKLEDSNTGVSYYEVTHGNKSLILVNHDTEYFGLIGLETLHVYSSLEEVNEQNGYY